MNNIKNTYDANDINIPAKNPLEHTKDNGNRIRICYTRSCNVKRKLTGRSSSEVRNKRPFSNNSSIHNQIRHNSLNEYVTQLKMARLVEFKNCTKLNKVTSWLVPIDLSRDIE